MPNTKSAASKKPAKPAKKTVPLAGSKPASYAAKRRDLTERIANLKKEAKALSEQASLLLSRITS